MIQRLARIVAVFVAFIAAGPLQAAEPGGDYTLTRPYSSVFFRVMYQNYLIMVGRFENYSAQLHLDVDNLANSTLSATVQMASLEMPDDDVVETLVNSSTWFNASLYPEATFTSTSTTVIDEDEVEFNGNLNFVGVTLPWTFHVKFFGGLDGELGGSSVGIQGSGTIDRLAFGLDQYRDTAADMVEIEVNAKFNK
jgi:polyisoprenoid-binding protein YceI